MSESSSNMHIIQNSSKMFIFQGLEISLSGGITMDDIHFFQIPLEGEIIYSNAPSTSSRSDRKLMIHLSPVSLVLSEDLMQLISSGMDPYSEVSISNKDNTLALYYNFMQLVCGRSSLGNER